MLKISKVNDATDVFGLLIDYILERCPKRYSTVEEAKEDVNRKFKNVMEVMQKNYDRWFETELFSNLGTYGIEIIGGDDVVIEDNNMGVDENELYNDEGNEGAEEVGNDFFEDSQQENPSPDRPENNPEENNRPV